MILLDYQNNYVGHSQARISKLFITLLIILEFPTIILTSQQNYF